VVVVVVVIVVIVVHNISYPIALRANIFLRGLSIV